MTRLKMSLMVMFTALLLGACYDPPSDTTVVVGDGAAPSPTVIVESQEPAPTTNIDVTIEKESDPDVIVIP